MCGVASIFAYHDAAPHVDRDELRRIRDHMIARGPDGSGEWYAQNGRVALGHRRLSIIDLSERAAQPMSSVDGRRILSFNGEIYNYQELRRRLEGEGCTFRSDSDTEVLLALYGRRGERMFDELRGMYAFVLWDADRAALLLGRDPYGIKPLYYADDGWTLRAASQVKALQAGGRVSNLLEPAGVVGFYLLGSVPEPFTTLQEVRAVPAGCFLWVDKLGPREPQVHFSIARTIRDAVSLDGEHAPAAQEQVRVAVLNSVGHHLVADVPVGAFLSSGIDSAALVGLARDAGQADTRTVTLAFEEFRGGAADEAPLAERIASHYGTRHTTRIVSLDEFQGDMERILAAMDQPSIDGVNTWFVSKAARELGLKVALSGLGGDELFGGYPSFSDIPRYVGTFSLPSRIPLLGRLTRWIGSVITHGVPSLSPKAAGLLEYGGSYAGAYLLRRGLFMPWELPALLGRELARAGLRRLSVLRRLEQAIDPDPGTAFGRVAALEASLYMRNQLLRDADWSAMSHSLEVRTPLVDARLLQTLAPLMHRRPVGLDKQMLAAAPRGSLPKEVLDRPKSGFTVPLSSWLEKGGGLETWRRLPLLRREGCHWARRWAYALSDFQQAA